jgi:small subunit ribosomal protein S8
MVLDPIADLLTRLRNAYAVHLAEVVIPASRLKLAIAEILVAEGYLVKAEKVADAAAISLSPNTSKRAARRGQSELLRLVLKYNAAGQPAAQALERVSKSSRRVYVTKEELPVVRSGLGIMIISTSQGVMTNRQAKKIGVGGEVICKIY